MRILFVLMFVLARSGPGLADDLPACPEVEIGGAKTYTCLNQYMRDLAGHPAAPTGVLSPSATDPANKTGSFSEAGTRERLGANFGKSAFPQRPPPAQFPAPLR